MKRYPEPAGSTAAPSSVPLVTMARDPNAPIKYPCPHCTTRNIETTATAPYVRGMVIAFQHGSKTFVGCVPCVRSKVLLEAGTSALIGWFSITSVFINPILIVYNVIQCAFIRVNYPKARARLREAGVPEDPAIDLTDVGCALAAHMITVDQTRAPVELQRATELGATFLRGCDARRLDAALANIAQMPSAVEFGAMLSDVSVGTKKAMFDYLLAVAHADGPANPAEIRMLTDVAEKMQYTPAG